MNSLLRVNSEEVVGVPSEVVIRPPCLMHLAGEAGRTDFLELKIWGIMEQKTKTSTRGEYVEELKQKLDKWNAELARLEDKARAAGSEAVKEYKSREAAFRRKRGHLEDKFREVQTSSDEAWTELKAGIEKAWVDVKDAFEQAKTRMD